MMTEEYLLPCPWCGQEMNGEIIVEEGSTFRWRAVQGCCTNGPEVRHNTLADDQVAAEAQSRQDAIDAWNNRDGVLQPRSRPLEVSLDEIEAMQTHPCPRCVWETRIEKWIDWVAAAKLCAAKRDAQADGH